MISNSSVRPPSAAPWWAYASLAASMSLVGSYVALSKPLVAALPVFLLAWLRFGIGAVAMVHWIRKPESEPPLDAPTHRLLFLQSFLGNFLFSVTMLFGVAMTTAVTAGLIMSALPAVVAILSRVFLKERLTRSTIAAIGCSAVGIALFSQGHHSPSGATGSQSWAGPLLVLASVVCEASYVVIGKRLTAAVGPRRISSIINLWGLALMTPLGIWAALSFDFSTVAFSIWWLLVFYGLAASVWTVWLWMTGLRHVEASKAGVFTVMLPVSAALVGVIFLGERPTPIQWAAFAVALTGVVLATLPSRNAKPVEVVPPAP